MNAQALGRVHSIQTLGTLDGPGVRFVAFLQGCNLRCGCCHNPDTWSMDGGEEYTAQKLADTADRYRSYFGDEGGVTLSGGEPLLQAEFASEFFKACRAKGMNTCLDTSGSIINDKVEDLLSHTDRVLLDIKYATDSKYKEYVGCSIELPLRFLELLCQRSIPTTLRQVVIPTLNDDAENTEFLKELILRFGCIDKVELLPFKKICKVKYDKMGLPFAFDRYDVPSKASVARLEEELNLFIKKRL